MIKVIGAKRLILLVALVFLNAALAAVTYIYLVPQESSTSKELRTLRSQNQAKSGDIQRMQIEFEQLGDQQDKFDSLKTDGFFKAQVRSVAKKLFKDIQDESRVVSAVASIRPGTIEENEEARKSAYKVLVSPVEIIIEAFDDSVAVVVGYPFEDFLAFDLHSYSVLYFIFKILIWKMNKVIVNFRV